MNFTPIILMNLILFTITVLLAIADKLLVNYGECKITIEQDEEKKEFTVQGGAYLLSYFIENKIPISASCGGKATCGYCKVRVTDGGGPILPTEEIFMSREEKLEDMRLACQVKVKNDVDIFIPDFLTTVKNIVDNELFDPKLKWQFSIANQINEDLDLGKIKITSDEIIAAKQMIEKSQNIKAALVPILQNVNEAYKYLPEYILRMIAEYLNIPFSQIFRIATFYNAFSLIPRGKYVVNVCLGTACYVKGSHKILEAFERELGIKVENTTADMKFSLKTVNCIGCCGQAPAITVNEDIYGYVKQIDIPKIISNYK